MPLHTLTYTRGAAPCPTLGGRTGEALGGGFLVRACLAF